MAELFFAEIPLAEGKKEDWIDIVNDPKGLALTKTMPGFISAEMAFRTNDAGQHSFLLWEKWETQEDYANYNNHPDRKDDCEFMQRFFSCVDGEPKMGFCETVSHES